MTNECVNLGSSPYDKSKAFEYVGFPLTNQNYINEGRMQAKIY